MSKSFEIESATEALADVWASMDRRQTEFRAGKKAKRIEDYGGYYAGYMADAAEVRERLAEHGYVIRRKPKP